MPIDIKSLRKRREAAKTHLNTTDLYQALPNKIPKLTYLRFDQGEILKEWDKRKKETDLVIKMNTGGGKTVAGLTLLHSSLKEGISNATYIVPNKFLIEQVIAEANELGLKTTQNPEDPNFLAGKTILVTNTYKLVNGLSIFGIKGGNREPLKLGAIVFDDAHRSLEVIEQQFTLTINKADLPELYNEILDTFSPALENQNAAKLIDINYGVPYYSMLVPFWSWQEKYKHILANISKYRDNESILFNWPLIKESLLHCKCVISGESISITPNCIPIDMIPSIADCPRRIFLTATLADDSVLNSHFGVSRETIISPIVPSNAGDIGDRIFICPEIIDPSINDADCMQLAKRISEVNRINVVVIVPSEYRSKAWENYANKILMGNNVSEGVSELKAGYVGLYVVVNRYDGIDLPNDACRVLILDSLPDERSSLEIIKQGFLAGSQKTTAQLAQTIEQGAGRAIRSADDYCAIILMGRNLCSRIYTGGIKEKFSPATSAQIALSEDISDMIINIQEIESVITGTFLARNEDWVTENKETLAQLNYITPNIDLISLAERKAFDFAEINDYSSAIECLESIKDQVDSSPVLGGYLRQTLAEYKNFIDRSEAQKIQKHAVTLNRQLIKPIEGISYGKSVSLDTNQASKVLEKIRTYKNNNYYLIDIRRVIDNLILGEQHTAKFEESIAKIGDHIGFIGRRPELEEGKGPDNLWSISENSFVVIECKSGASSETINKHHCNQLNGSVVWFNNSHPHMNCFPLLIHPKETVEYAASLHMDSRIMTEDKLINFKSNLNAFATAISSNFNDLTIPFITEQLKSNYLDSGTIFHHHSKIYKKANK